MNGKRWFIRYIGILLAALLCIAAFVVTIDPCFHFHAPLKGMSYRLDDERYTNNGIQRHFPYELMVTGTSMSQNIHASLVESLWGLKTVKTAYSGATFHELCENMERALSYNNDLKVIICSLDPNRSNEDFDSYAYSDYPDYLYDENPFNDVNYVFNKDIIEKSLSAVKYTISGGATTDFDSYGRFDHYVETGREAVLSSFERMAEQDLSHPFTEEDGKRVSDNTVLNYVNLAKANPDVEFIFYIPPYSYCYWDAMVRTKQLDFGLETEKQVVKLLLEQPNIKVFAFDDHTEITTNLDYYSDTLHYNGEICDELLRLIKEGQGELSPDNYNEYYDRIKDIYENMEYDF